MKGHTYLFPVAEAFYYDEEKSYEVSVKLTIGGQDYTNKAYTVSNDFVLKYTAVSEETGKTTTLLKTIKVITPSSGKGFIKDYFYSSDLNNDSSEDVEIYYDESNLQGINFKTSINEAQVYFANVFTVQDFKTSIMISDVYNNFESVDVYLTDSVKATNKVKISFKKDIFFGT